MNRTRIPHFTWAPLLAAVLLASCGGQRDAADGSADTAAATATAASTASTDIANRARRLAAVSPLAVALPQAADAAADPLLQGLTISADAPTRGMWSAVQAWPMNAIHAALLPNGKVLTYGTPLNTDSQDGRTFDVWTPALGFGAAAHVSSFEAGRVNSFCSTATWLTDGRLIVSGGNTARGSNLVNAVSGGIATEASQMADDRWYATMLTLPDGRALIVGGIDPYTESMVSNPEAAIQNGQVSMTPEIYTPGTGWRTLPGAKSRDAFGPDYLRASYPRSWVAPNGQVFGISSETMWYLDPAANNGSGSIRIAGKFKTPASNTAPVNVGATNSAVMFAPGRILQMGGNGYFNGDGYPGSNMATIVDINGANPVLTETTRMSYARRYVNALVLPDGKVLASGGTKVGNNGGSDAVFATEIWNPDTGTWTVGASAVRIRVYHSSTMLLPNGTVLSLGGGTPGPQYNPNVEVYYPPYLFRSVNGAAQLAPRPVMTGISALSFAPGATLQIDMLDASAVSRLVLVGNSTVTHSFNVGQRHIPLTFTQDGDRLTATLPATHNTVPPGYYQVFALNAAGVPSRGVIVGIGVAASPPPAPVLPRDQPITLDSLSVAGSAVGVDAGGLAVLQALGATPSSSALASARFWVRNGLADASCISLEYAATPGRWLRHYNYRPQLGSNDNSAVFAADATFCPEPGLAGNGLTLRSKNYPAYVLRHRDGQVWLDAQTPDAAFSASASWAPHVWDTSNGGLPTITPFAAPPKASGSSVSWAPGLDATGLEFSWNFGDGSAPTAFGSSSAASYTFAQPGVYGVTLTVRNAQGQTSSYVFSQAVYAPVTANAPRASSALLWEPRSGAAARLWVVNPDNDSVSVFDTATNTRLKEIAVGAAPRTLALAPSGQVWVVNRDGASLSLINPSTLAVASTVALPRASQPYGLVFAPNGGAAYVTLEAGGRVLKLNPSTGAQTSSTATGATPRHLAISGDSARLLVTRFITPPLAGEGTASVNTASGGGQVLAFNTSNMALAATVLLQHSSKTDNEIQGSGLPNYLGAPAIAPGGASAWVPSKQDNIARGTLRNGLNLDFQNSVRAISSRLLLGSLTEDGAARIDHDNASLASAATHDPTGSYLFVALETARQVAVVDAARGRELFRIEVGLAPQAVQVAADGRTLYVHNFMSRNVSVVSLAPLMANGELRSAAVATLASITTEKLAAAALRGKQLFYDARDTRLARDAYMSCAVCHNDGGHDGRSWDFTGLGEGLRNTISLRGRAGLGHGRLHWSGNFDEVQDFEGQIRNFAGGTGLLSDAQFNTGTRSQPLGDAKAGLSTELDALAAYVSSLTVMPLSPDRSSAGALSSAASSGLTVFRNQRCAHCHGGASFASGNTLLADVGTIKASSGMRLGAALTGLDVPTLRDVAATGPWLHDGSAATLQAAVSAHRGVSLSATDLNNLAAYLAQIGSEEALATVALPSGTTSCASNNGTCTLPSGVLATVYYGASAGYTSRPAVSGSIACSTAAFGGDPAPGSTKTCRYLAATKCAAEGANCVIPSGSTATVYYGANGKYHARGGVSGTLACGNTLFGDPASGVAKSCWRQ
jgi:YVTN family beta-propeller protein